MLHSIKKAAALSLVSMAALVSYAQDNQSGYFVDDYTYRYLMNPAMANSKNFVAMPALGNFNFGLQGNLSVKDVLYNVNGRTTTFLNPGVSASEVMNNLGGMNKTGFNLRENILAVGFKGLGGYNTINLSARANVNLRVPGSIFSLLKEGVANKDYEITDLGASAMAWGELSLGHSRNITSEIRVGANLKFLVGIAGIDANLDNAHLQLDANSWNITTNARIHTAIKGMNYKMDRNSHTGIDYVSGLDGDFSAPNGFGVAVDLGATYKPKKLKDWEFSLALLDLGVMSWSNDLYATTNGDKTFRTADYTFNPDDNAPNSFSDEWKRMRDQLETLYQLDYDGIISSRSQALNATMNVGAAYTLPVWRKAKFGLVNTTRIAGRYSWTDFRLSANIAPCKVFSMSVSGNVGTLGSGFGWMANLHCPGFNLFLAQDNAFFSMAKQGVPLASTASASLGINFLF